MGSYLFFCLLLFCVHCAVSEPLSEEVATTKDQFDLPIKAPENLDDIKNGLTSLFTLGLMGGAMALYSPKHQPQQSIDRQGLLADPSFQTYRQKVNQFERRVFNRFANSMSRVGSSARKATGTIRNAARRTGQRSFNVLRAGANSVRRVANVADSKLRGIARTTNRGLRKISSRMNRVGTGGIERMGSAGTNLGTAAIRGFYKVSRSYLQGLDRARVNALSGLKRAGRTYRRGLSRVGNAASGIASAYSRGVKRMGTAANQGPSLRDIASDGVSRLGEIASQSAATIGGMASDVSEAALAVPKSISNVAKDQKMRDCLLQTMCYVSTGFIDPNSNYVRRKRSSDLEEIDLEKIDEEILDLNKLNKEGQALRMEDCDAFKCEMVSLGKQAYEIVSKNIYK